MIESTDDNLKGSFNNLKGFHDYNFFFKLPTDITAGEVLTCSIFPSWKVQARPKSENYPRCR